MPYVVKQPIRLDTWPRARAASIPGVPQACATARKAVYMAPIWAAPGDNQCSHRAVLGDLVWTIRGHQRGAAAGRASIIGVQHACATARKPVPLYMAPI